MTVNQKPTRIWILPPIAEHISVRDILRPQASIISPPYPFPALWELDPGRHPFWEVQHGHYKMALWLERKDRTRKCKPGFRFQRNSSRVSIELMDRTPPPSHISICATWTPTSVSLNAMYLGTTGDPVFSGELSARGRPTYKVDLNPKAGEPRVETSETRTPITRVPPSLWEWARKNSLTPSVSYTDQAEVLSNVVDAFESIQDKIRIAGAHMLWKRGPDGWQPKSECELQIAIMGLIQDVALQKRLSITREPVLGSGRLDFLAEAHLECGKTVRVCVEAKCAHHPDLRSGLLMQLPEYMQAAEADLGVFLVVSFKGTTYSKPNEFASAEDLLGKLQLARTELGNSPVRVIVLDAGVPQNPSKMKAPPSEAANPFAPEA